MILNELIEQRKARLAEDIEIISTDKLRQVEALVLCDKFISSATKEAAYGDGFSFFGRMRNASESLPEKFEQLDECSMLKGADRRLQPYIRSQLFLALVAELEDFLSQLLIKVLESYPHKLRDKGVQLKQILDFGTIEALISDAATKEIVNLFYAGPSEYRKTIEEILSLKPDILKNSWPLFVEMKARRDVGLHSGWQRNEIYNKKVTEGGGSYASSTFLGIGQGYFESSIETARILIEGLRSHCLRKFGSGQTM